MNRALGASWLILFFLLGSCTEEKIINSTNLGNIKGRVMSKKDSVYSPEASVTVEISGVSVQARTDSAGNFILLNLPEGIYNLTVNHLWIERVDSISVQAGKTTTINDIVYELPQDVNIPDLLYAVYFRLANTNAVYLYMNDTCTIDIKDVSGDSLELFGLMQGYISTTQDTQITICYDSVFYYTSTFKGIFKEYLEVQEGLCKLKIWPGHSESMPETFFTTTVNVINAAPTTLSIDWSTTGNQGAGDFDIHLINKVLNDSCWYKNPHPDWGIQNYNTDDPVLGDYSNSTGSTNGYEELNFFDTPDGSYHINVVYYSNVHDENILVTPIIYMGIDGRIKLDRRAPAAMSVGDIWNVADFTMPDAQVTIINTIIKN
jgi:hypothetical protein